jgi:hypothetical protein
MFHCFDEGRYSESKPKKKPDLPIRLPLFNHDLFCVDFIFVEFQLQEV